MNKKYKQHLLRTIAITLLALGVQSAAHAVDTSDTLAIHGYGHQGYLQSNDNTYLGADGHGSWDYNLLALLFTATVDDSTKIWLQLHSTAADTRLDWAFVEYQFNPNFSGRAGQIKFPYGLYNEFIYVHFLQLSTLPPFLYRDTGLRYESFRGLAVKYKQGFGTGVLDWDGYAGQELNVEEVGKSKFGRLLGGRVTYKTPVDGLRFMAAAFGSNEEDIASGMATRQKSYALSVEYTAGNWDVTAETARNKEFGISSSTSYIQAGYTLGEKWTPFMRYDYITTDQARKFDPSYYQKTTTVGLNYKINSSVSVRLEDNINNGYALPVKTGEITAGAGTKNWSMLAASVNFIF